MADRILCIGEVLWDALPAGLFLGGAPFNAACHLHELGRTVCFASRVGNDELGREIVRRLRRRGMRTDLLQTDPELATGFVIVSLDAAGSPTFEIVHPSAWDAIEPGADLVREAGSASAIVFGSLAQRSERTRQTVRRLLEVKAKKVFDVNLRPPFDGCAVVEESLRAADVVKLNDDELRRLTEWFGLPAGLRDAAAALSDRYACETVCVTRGANGACLWHQGAWHDHPGFSVEVADAVGSGDAFLARLLSGFLAKEHAESMLAAANALGAYVATRHGATPRHDAAAIASLARRRV
ncbi:MAG: carbohydrate kinase [Kiritimatiellae bacterium]|nr:carbohydrate kinase [Kiritimatiellia bacterium]